MRHSAEIVLIVFVLMTVVEYVELRSRGRIRDWLKDNRNHQYLASSVLGATPGCAGAFGAVTLYTHGFLSIGSIAAAMIATSGDEAFLMLTLFPKRALLLFGILLVLGIVAGFITDQFVDRFHIEKCEECKIKSHREGGDESKDLTFKHFLRAHVFEHILKEHIPKITLWVFGGLFFIKLLNSLIGLEAIIQGLPVFILVTLAAFVGLLPGSGPHIPFVLLYSTGAISFPVLLANSIVQDGHGLFPMLSYTVRDSVMVKVINGVFGIIVGFSAVFLWRLVA